MSRLSSTIAVIVASMTIGCGEGSPRDESIEQFSRVDSAGVTYVRNFGRTWTAGDQWLIADTLLRIGSVSGDQATMFSRITDVTRLSSGLVVVLDGIGELRAFSLDGEHQWTSGRMGEGPGEFRGPRSLRRSASDLIEVEDRTARIVFDGAGNLVEHETIDWGRIADLGSFVSSECRLVPIFQENGLLLTACSPEAEPREGASPIEVVIGKVPSTLDRVDTVGVFLRETSWGLQVTGGVQPVPLPLGERGYLAVGGDPLRLIYGTSHQYRLDVYDLAGIPRRISTIERTDGMRAPTAAEVEAAWTSWESVANSFRQLPFGNFGPALDAAREAIGLPDSTSLVRGIVVDDTNASWIRTSATVGEDVIWDIFSAEGVYLGEVRLPGRVTLHEVGEDYLLGVDRDELNVEYVVMLSLDRER